MKSKDITIKNISLMLLILLPILMIVLEKNGITLMNNAYVYIYLAIYLGLSVTYALVTNKTSNWLGPLVLIYLIFAFCSYTGSYSSYKSPSNKNKLIVENKTVFLNSAKLTVSKGICGILKKELFQTSSTGSQGWSVFWKDDSSIILTGPAVAEFKDFYKHDVLDNHYINMIKENKIEILFSEGILINID